MKNNTNFLLGSVGRRATLLQYIKNEWNGFGKLGGVDIYADAPGLGFVDMARTIPPVKSDSYIDCILDLCSEWNIGCVTSLLDVETVAMSGIYETLLERNVLPLLPSHESACICLDKLRFHNWLELHGLPSIPTYTPESAFSKLENKELLFPVFIKPRTGAGSVDSRRVDDVEGLVYFTSHSKSEMVVQPFIEGEDCNADAYTDCCSGELVSVFMKRKRETRIGGASKTISYFDPSLIELIEKLNEVFSFNGPVDMDFFRLPDGNYLVTEINPRFGGSYLHAHACGLNFPALIRNNLKGHINPRDIGDYPVDVVMSMYDSIMVKGLSELPGGCR